MTAPLRSTPHSQLPASQTAPVAEFRCLYTPDIRKKQKKWHDGYLKFHSFNSRVMVYDQARNFLGDTYYKDSDQLYEGDELTLDKGVMVEVADAIGVTQTDLKPLFEKKPKEAPPPPTAPPRRFQPPSQIARPQVTPAVNTARANAQQPRHKSLNALLGTPKGPIGKSVPIKSPYEARQEKEREKENDFAVERAAKRQKITHGSIGSAALRLSSPGHEDSPALKKTLSKPTKSANLKTVPAARPVPEGIHVINLEENEAPLPPSSSPSLPGTPPPVSRVTKRITETPAPHVEPVAVEQPAIQTPRIPRGKVPVPSVKAVRTPQAPVPPSSPPVSASNRLTNVNFAVEPTPLKETARKPPNQPAPLPPVEFALPPPGPKAKSLRLSRGVKRGTLMICQPQPPPPRSRETSEVQSAAARSPTRIGSTHKRLASPLTDTLSATKAKRRPITERGNLGEREDPRQEPSVSVLEIGDDDQEAVLGSMDQRLLVAQTPPPEALLVPASPEMIVPTAKTSKATEYQSHKGRVPSSRISPPALPPASAVTHDNVKQKPAEETRASRIAPIQTSTAVGMQDTPLRAASPALGAITDSRSRTSSTSPRKLAALSTGGFRRKGKTATPPPNAQAPVQSKAARRNETVELPPHPLRASKNGPVMTTTELAAMLQQPKRKPRDTANPIEDEGDTAGVSPNRKFRRVRSENDAPIPSTSEDWEKRNLPKGAATDTPDVPDATTKVLEVPAVAARKKSGLAALIKKTDPRRQFVRTKSLTIDSNVAPSPETESPMVSPITDKDIGPWSTEAFDLFDWRPPREVGP